MYQRTLEAQESLQATRRKVLAALNEASREGANWDCTRHLTCLNLALLAAEFTAVEAVNAAQVRAVRRSHMTAEEFAAEGM